MNTKTHRKRLREQMQVGLGLNRMLYGLLSVIYIVLGYAHLSSSADSALIHWVGVGFSLSLVMAVCGLILTIDGLVALMIVAFPKVKVIQTICNLATRSRIWCFIPISFCYLGFAFLMLKEFTVSGAWYVALPMNFVLSAFGLAFSLHENVIVNEKNRYKENVCTRD